LRSHQHRKGAEVGFATETRRRNLRGISQAKSERVRRTWIPTTSLIISCSSLPFVQHRTREILRRSPPSCQIGPSPSNSVWNLSSSSRNRLLKTLLQICKGIPVTAKATQRRKPDKSEFCDRALQARMGARECLS
jgi:hypothetical protein